MKPTTQSRIAGIAGAALLLAVQAASVVHAQAPTDGELRLGDGRWQCYCTYNAGR
jgi:invasion protein IalB